MKIKNSIIHPLLYAVVAFLFFGPCYGQKKITMSEALEITLKNNMNARSARLQEKYRQALVNASGSLPPLAVNTTLGQFNSAYFDTGIGVSQSFSLPRVYRVAREAAAADLKSAEFFTGLTGAELRREVEDHFDLYSMLQERHRYLMQLDTMYTATEAKARMRWEKGETDILEHLTARQNMEEVRRQLTLLSSETDAHLISFNLLLNDPDAAYQPAVATYKPIIFASISGDSWLESHPEVMLAAQEWKASMARTNVEKAAKLPGITVGYQNISIRGTGADNKVYNAGDRFSNFQLGIAVPVYRKNLEANIKASLAAEEIRSARLEATRHHLSGEYRKNLDLYTVAYRSLQDFEKNSVRDAATIMQVSRQKLDSGAINYLEYVQLTNLAADIRNRHIDLIRTVNSYAIRLHFLTNQFNF